MRAKVLLIMTGGTISMVKDPKTGALRPASLDTFKHFVPEVEQAPYGVELLAFNPMIDSSDVHPADWVKMAQTIESNYDAYDGFVILHGTDTMSYSASALSFLLEDLTKPVIFTGSQLPIGVLRSDAKENLQAAIEIAAAKNDAGQAMVPEVSIYFEDRLFRANRTTKRNAEHFSAFNSYNYPPLAKVGVHITYQPTLIHYPSDGARLKVHTKMDGRVAVLKLFPGITEAVVDAILSTPDLQGVVLETYGAGNAPSCEWLYQRLSQAIQTGIIIVNKTQCNTGSVQMGLYEVSRNLLKAGVLSGHDITTEALLTKMMCLLGEYPNDKAKVIELLQQPLCGELTNN